VKALYGRGTGNASGSNGACGSPGSSGETFDKNSGSRSEPAAAHADAMIDLGSIAGLHERNHELHAFCPRCDRWSILPLARMVAQGQGGRRLPLTLRCRWCGAAGQLQVRPPMPSRTSAGWIDTSIPAV
jgi:hypothetical protein